MQNSARKSGNTPKCADCYYFRLETDDETQKVALGYCYNKKMFDKDCSGKKREKIPEKWRTENHNFCHWFEDAISRQSYYEAVTEDYKPQQIGENK